MARAAKHKMPKGRNGVGDSVTVYFDPTDPAERKALEAARLLATKHGRRKQAIIALLEAVYNHYEATGELLSASEISGALVGGSGRDTTHFGMMGASAHHAQLNAPSLPQPKARRKPQHSGGIDVTRGTNTSTDKVAANFLRSVSSIASGFFD